MPDERPGRRALAQIDEALRAKPEKHDHALSHATMGLAAFRDGLVAELRENGLDAAGRQQLSHANAVMTMVLAVHFPLGEVPWDELGKARAWLAEIVGEDEPVA